MEKCQKIKQIEEFLNPKTIEKETYIDYCRDTMEYLDHFSIGDAYFAVSILEKEDYLIFDEIDEEEKRLNILIKRASQISENESNTLHIEPLNSKHRLKELLYFKEKLIEELKKEDRCEMIYLLNAY